MNMNTVSILVLVLYYRALRSEVCRLHATVHSRNRFLHIQIVPYALCAKWRTLEPEQLSSRVRASALLVHVGYTRPNPTRRRRLAARSTIPASRQATRRS